MTTGADSSLFLDTNILVYANVEETPLHQAALQAVEAYYQNGATLWVSRQILREFMATLTRPQSFGNPRPVSTVIERVHFFQEYFSVAEDGPDVTAQLLALIEQIPTGGKQIHDANIVATMLAHGITHLLTHNTADFARFAQFITIVPL